MKANVIEVTQRTFQRDVIEQSKHVPVLVDFWAPWCGPCRTLTPVLEQLAAEGEGSWILAKLNTDENQQLAQQFNVRGIPNVKAFRDGKVVDEFVGAQPRPAVKRFIDTLLPNPLDHQVAAAEELLAENKAEQARTLLEQVLARKPDHEGAHLALARVELAQGQPEAALPHLDAIPIKGPLGPAAESLRVQARFAGNPSSSLAELTARVASDPTNLDARYQLARAAIQQGEYPTAADHLLAVIQQQRDYQDGAAHQAMLDLFVLMGESDPRTKEYRRRLSWTLFS